MTSTCKLYGQMYGLQLQFANTSTPLETLSFLFFSLRALFLLPRKTQLKS
eukprot:Gb_12207 [translate_table: standard]